MLKDLVDNPEPNCLIASINPDVDSLIASITAGHDHVNEDTPEEIIEAEDLVVAPILETIGKIGCNIRNGTLVVVAGGAHMDKIGTVVHFNIEETHAIIECFGFAHNVTFPIKASVLIRLTPTYMLTLDAKLLQKIVRLTDRFIEYEN